MTEKLKPCWCGELPDLMRYFQNGKTIMYYMRDQTIDEHQPHALIAYGADSEENARQNWNMMMDAIGRHYSRKNLKIKYSEAKFLVKELKRLAVEDTLRKHLYLIEFVETEKSLTHNIIKFWWKSSTLRASIKRILKGGNND